MRACIRHLLLAVSFLAIGPAVWGQTINKNQLALKVGPFLKKVGALEGYSVTAIIDTFKSAQYGEVEMVYAIYSWIAGNVGFDSKAFHHRGKADLTASNALRKRRAVSEGYAALFKAMCDIARIECVVITGLAKSSPEAIGEIGKEHRHNWNAIKLKNTWYYIDVTWAAGTTDSRFRNFEQQFSDAWFFSNRALFLLSHFPDDSKWQLTDEPITKTQFSLAPSVGPSAIVFQVYPPEGWKGKLRARQHACKRLVMETDLPSMIRKVELQRGDRKEPVDFYIEDHLLSVDIPLPEHGSYCFTIHINDAPAFGFKAQVSKKKRS